MLDLDGLIVKQDRPPQVILTQTDLCKLYGEPVAWDNFNNAIDQIAESQDVSLGSPLTDNEVVKLNHYGIPAKLASVDMCYEPCLFAAAIAERAHMSHVSIAIVSVSVDNTACELFVENTSAILAALFATITAVSAGRSTGVNAEHLAKVWCIPHGDAARTLKVTTQSLHHDQDLSHSRNGSTINQAVKYWKIRSYFFPIHSSWQAVKSSQGNRCAQLFVSNKGCIALLYPMKKEADYFLSLKQVAKDIGTPDVLVCDPHPAQTKHEV